MSVLSCLDTSYAGGDDLGYYRSLGVVWFIDFHSAIYVTRVQGSRAFLFVAAISLFTSVFKVATGCD